MNTKLMYVSNYLDKSYYNSLLLEPLTLGLKTLVTSNHSFIPLIFLTLLPARKWLLQKEERLLVQPVSTVLLKDLLR